MEAIKDEDGIEYLNNSSSGNGCGEHTRK